MDELEELMEHHIQMAIFGVTMCTRAVTAQFLTLAEDALEGATRCS